MKPFAFIVASAATLALIHAYGEPGYAGPQGASTDFDQNSVQVPIAPFRVAGGKDNNMVCGNGIGHVGECNNIDFDVTVILW